MSFAGGSGVMAADLFAGAGGLSIGLAEAGFDVVVAAEWDVEACDTYEKHHPSTEMLRGDIASGDSLARLAQYRGRVHLLAGGPPCQPWSTGGLRRGADDPRNGFPLFVLAVKLMQPEAIFMENVSGVLRGTKTALYDSVLRDLRELGYNVVAKEVNAANYGVPQKRRRVIAVGLRDREFEFPPPTHGPGFGQMTRTAGDVLRLDYVMGEPNPSVVTYARNPDIRPNPYDGHVYNGGGRPIDLSKPAPTLLASMGGNKTPWLDTRDIVPEYHAHLLGGGKPRSGVVPGARRITVAEAAALQTFPLGIHLAGHRSSQYRQVGNAVPPALAAVLGCALLKQLA